MVGKPHRQNTKFQLRYFLAGSCTTPDGAYVLLYGQLNDMQSKVAHVEAQLKRRQAKLKAAEAKKAEAEATLANESDYTEAYRLRAESDLLDAEAEFIEIAADVPTWEKNVQGAQQELKDIEELMAELKPMCKWAHLDILEQGELSQQEEWLGELKRRAENFLLTAGTIPHDHFQTMRMHPQFKTELVPHIQLTTDKARAVGQAISYAPGAAQQKGYKTWADMVLSFDQSSAVMLAAPETGIEA